jgi:hypothetical protein
MKCMWTKWAWAMLVPVASLTAQPPLNPGMRVRLWLSSPTTDSVIGAVKASGRDTVTVALAGGTPQRIPLASVLRIEASRGRSSRWLDGTIAGAAVGAAVGIGYAVGHTRSESRQRRDYLICFPASSPCTEEVVMPGSSVSKPRAAAIGALAGGGVGILFGATARGPERWQDVWVRDRSARQQTRVP